MRFFALYSLFNSKLPSYVKLRLKSLILDLEFITSIFSAFSKKNLYIPRFQCITGNTNFIPVIGVTSTLNLYFPGSYSITVISVVFVEFFAFEIVSTLSNSLNMLYSRPDNNRFF